MTNSMKDLLLGLGFKPVAKGEPQPAAGKDVRAGKPGAAPGRGDRDDSRRGKPRGEAPTNPGARAKPIHRPAREGMDLAKAYALRAQQEKDERISIEREKQEAARVKREAKAKVVELLKDKSRNDAAAELVRHFDYNGKIRRVHVDAEQLKALNAGALGVVQIDGRYLLVDADVARQVQALLPSLLALLVDPHAPVAEDPYADPKYAIPDDLTW